MSLKEAMSELKDYKVEYSGSGNKVFYQTPKPGERVFVGDTIKLMLKE